MENEIKLDLCPFDKWEVWVVAAGERAKGWRETFGVAGVPVESVFPRLMVGVGDPEPRLCYMLAMDWLDEDFKRRERVVADIAKRFGFTPLEVENDLKAGHGIPLLAEGLAVVINGVVVERGEFGP